MYHSRKRITNGRISLAVDTISGELIELTDELTGDNLIKNHLQAVHQPFSLVLHAALGHPERRTAWPARHAQIMDNADLQPDISCTKSADGSQTLTIHYPDLYSDDGQVGIEASCEIILPADGCILNWRLQIDNHAGLQIEKVLFPSVHGIYLGDTWEDDTLVYPYFAGEKTVNPVAVYASEPVRVSWKWQEYKYTYLYAGRPGVQAKEGAYVREQPYSGPLSMLWLDYADPDHGLYLACHETGGRVLSLRTETFGPSQPGMGLSIVHHPYHESGRWTSPACTIALHAGDWHWGADQYRTARHVQDGLQMKTRPGWFEREPGLVAHYDFKYQHGGIVHRFRDIPDLHHQAMAMGFNFLLLSGWHQDGFDNGFPEYQPDPDLGSEQDLIDALAAVRAEGGHVIFYVNARLTNTRYAHRSDQREAHCARKADGSLHLEQYGDRGITFATYCANSAVWQQELANVVTYLTDTVGASGVYLDQLGMAPPVFCFNPQHNHHPADWNLGYQAFFRSLFPRYDRDQEPAIIYEGVTDLYGAGVSGQLISTFVHHHGGAAPEVYKYTHPDQILVDMIYPRRGQAMRPVHVAQQGRAMMDRAFVIGSFYWVYDLEEDNSFSNDPESLAYLCKMTALRRFWLERFGHGTFRDTEGIAAVTEGITVKRYCLSDQTILLAVANPQEKNNGMVRLCEESLLEDSREKTVNLSGYRCTAMTYGLSRPEDGQTVQLQAEGNHLVIPLSPELLSLIWIQSE
ncbi:MAG: DUF6259 domain-containing protein [Bacillota bacterium]|nr:DUF6259 domain-containing protein [Bacillota bacterium]